MAKEFMKKWSDLVVPKMSYHKIWVLDQKMSWMDGLQSTRVLFHNFKKLLEILIFSESGKFLHFINKHFLIIEIYF